PSDSASGSLRLIATSEADRDPIDPAGASDPGGWSVLRALTRQLMTYPPGGREPVPDVAAQPPEVSDDGLTYTFTLRANVRYAPPRQAAVSAGDFVIGIKRQCDPNVPSSGAGLFMVIDGMKAFCDGLGAVAKHDPAAVRSYIGSNQITGLSAPSPTTLEFRLTRPVGDFVNLLATPYASPIPADALADEADSEHFRSRFPASGPYAVGEYNQHKRLRLVRNANQPRGDANRHAYADVIDIQLVASSQAGAVQVIHSGAAELPWRTAAPPEAVSKAEGEHDPLLHIDPSPCMNYLVLNQRRPAMHPLAARQALNLAVDKPALLDGIAGFPNGGTRRGGFLPDTVAGFEDTGPYDTEGGHGDPGKARDALLTLAPVDIDFLYPLPLVETADGLKYVDPATLPPDAPDQSMSTSVIDTGPPARWPALAKQVAAALGPAGFNVRLHPVPNDEFYLKHVEPGVANDWDVAPVTWCPEWPGLGARTLFAVLFDARPDAGGYDFGGYQSAEADSLADAAAAERNPGKAADLWRQVDQQVMADAAIVPLGQENTATFVGKAVRNWAPSSFLPAGDLPNLQVG
ncbi:MAG: peptide/nickel transport system substrate-binding protein, partial [Acidimicrobiaceae bacterium]|nr:peptide/nickel transport system substrate-binding protein [Acidimicrobiaceae bacterium]